MLRQVSRTRSAAAAAVRLASKQTRRHLSVPSKGPPPPKVAVPAGPKTPSSVPPKAPPAPPKTPSAPAAAESSTGSSLPRLLLLGLLSAPAATAVYVKQNPEWNPAALKDDERWLKFRELVLGKEVAAKETPAVAVKGATAVVAKQPTSRTPEEFSSAITKGQQAAKKAEKVEKKEQKKVEKAEKKLEKKDHKPEKKEQKKVEKVEKVEKKLEKAEKKAEKAEKKNDLLSSLKAESNAAAAEMDKQYLSGLHLDANALAIRVAQLATEMKHRSKWEAVRLLESLRRMEEDAQ
ncbi:hypothetical protein BBJ28_00024698, partial [Nothophytophthora sp. Chile5]